MLRIQILPSGEYLDLSKDTVATVELFSSIMNKESELLGSYSQNFNLPWNEHNKRVLQNTHLLSSSQAYRTMQARIWLGATPWKVVVFKYCVNEGLIEATLNIDNGVAMNALKTNKLSLFTGLQEDPIHFTSHEQYRNFLKATALAEPGVYPMVFFPIKNTAFIPEIEPDQQGNYPLISFPLCTYMNDWDAVQQRFNIDLANPYKHLQTPAYYLVYVIRRVLTSLGYTPVGGWLDHPDTQRIVMLSAVGINNMADFLLPDAPFFWPDMPFNEFFKVIRNRFSLIISFNESDKSCLIDSADLLFNRIDCIDLRGYQVKKMRDYLPEVTGYTITDKIEEKDELFNEELYPDAIPEPIVVGDGANELELQGGSTKMLLENNPNYGNAQVQWRVPHIKQNFYTDNKYPGADPYTHFDRNKFGLRFLYYHGMKKDQAGNLYPYASADNLDLNGQALGEFSLTPTENSRTRVTVEAFYNFKLKSKKIKVSYVLPERVFCSIVNHKRILVRDLNDNVVSCVIDQLSADLGPGDTVAAEAIMYVRPLENNLQAANTGEDPPPPVDNGTVYIRLSSENEQYGIIGDYGPDMSYVMDTLDLRVSFFSDAAGTIPKSVTNLLVRYRTRQNSVDTEPLIFDTDITITGTTGLLSQGLRSHYMESVRDENGNMVRGREYVQFFNLVDTGQYTIIS